jgi:hypothetical protein
MKIHLACGCIDILHDGCIYNEILDLAIVFIIFRGAFAPPNQHIASPLNID